MSADVGIILSGGGARGAYEAGVLDHVFRDVLRGRSPNLGVVSGTSVGAFNGVGLAAHAEDLGRATERLVARWSELALGDVLQFGMRQAASLPRVLLGGTAPRGIFDARPLARMVRHAVSWRRVAENVASGRVRALTVTATHVATGRPVVFMDLAPDVAPPLGLPDAMLVRRGHILPPHVLASAAIPIAFPPVEIGADLYCDGGLRLNTPMAPAIRLGAQRLLVIGVATAPERTGPPLEPGKFPGAPFLLGKVLNAFLLDHVLTDLDDLQRTNAILEDGAAVGGPGFLERLNIEARRRGHPPRRVVKTALVRPSVDLGRLAADFLQKNRARFGRSLGRGLFGLLDAGEGADADLASYLLFDAGYVRTLVELGRADARARRDELAALFEPPGV